jgi:hypothetical protein
VVATDDERRHQHGRTAEHAAGKSTATVELEEAGHRPSEREERASAP